MIVGSGPSCYQARLLNKRVSYLQVIEGFSGIWFHFTLCNSDQLVGFSSESQPRHPLR